MGGGSEGFTLIELLVVISIIGFLSSVVLASLQTARERAMQVSFMMEMKSMINALELYKSANGAYPYSTSTPPSSSLTYKYIYYSNNTDSVSSGVSLSAILLPYITRMPKVPNPSSPATFIYSYKTNVGVDNHYKCVGDITVPEYVILISINNNPILGGAFKNFPNAEWSSSPYTAWNKDSANYCYSPK